MGVLWVFRHQPGAPRVAAAQCVGTERAPVHRRVERRGADVLCYRTVVDFNICVIH